MIFHPLLTPHQFSNPGNHSRVSWTERVPPSGRILPHTPREKFSYTWPPYSSASVVNGWHIILGLLSLKTAQKCLSTHGILSFFFFLYTKPRHSAFASVILLSIRFGCEESSSHVKTLSSLSQSLDCSWAGFVGMQQTLVLLGDQCHASGGAGAFGWMFCTRWRPRECQDAMFSITIMHCNEMVSVIHLDRRCF